MAINVSYFLQALQNGQFELDELNSALYMTNFGETSSAASSEFIFRIVGRPMQLSNKFEPNSNNVLWEEEEVQLITIDLSEWKQSVANARARPKCAEVYQTWNV